ncbi:MAG: isoleucine--tRNA ligase [Dehalococcoidia bacterium]|nr:isoleucine--tRNA ligase [Dehalococcoidia bacterium]
MFKPVSSKVSFPEVEKQILAFWKEESILQKTNEVRRDGPEFVLYDGPPTVNGNPGIHHVLSRIYKDVIPRYKTMKGYRVFRKAGWDTHGLPVELEIEKELKFTNKAQIEEYGIAKFNAKCRESVQKYLKKWEELTDRIGFWLDMEHPYITYHTGYVESCWWIIKQLWDRGLVYQGYRVTPHCPRCGTSLSSHEVALGYKDAEDPSIYVRFRLSRDVQNVETKALKELGWSVQSGSWEQEVPALLAWTTTPWTMTGNVALAVSPNETYVLAQAKSPQGTTERLIMAQALLDRALGSGNWEILAEFTGKDIAGLYYDRLYEPKPDFIPAGDKLPQHSRAMTADYVSVSDGTGIVHIAPAFGEEDFDLGKVAGLPMVQSVDLDGKMIPNGKAWDGKFVKKADPMILEDLEQRGILHHQEKIVHTYPFCWRCQTPLLYYAKPSWYIKTTAYKDEMVSGNRDINWYPDYIKEGRFGDWLEHNIDWGLSRERYWGTPLPIWRCGRDPGHMECIGGIQELKSKPGVAGIVEPVDPHRPFVDEITFDCAKCGGQMKRAPEVLDAWFDSGAMPLAQFHYPFEDKAEFETRFPGDYIAEAIDQTRGWFYTLHALSILLFGKPCFKNVVCLGHIVDAKGEKMSKSKGNVIDPWRIINNQGADALRWYMFTTSPAGNPKRLSVDQVNEAMRKVLSTVWNTYSFFVIYANIDQFDPVKAKRPATTDELDRWIISELNQLINEVDKAYTNYDPTEAGRKIEEFVDYLSNWYVRRNRRRFWKGENDTDKLSAYFALYDCLVTLSKLMAPLTPFLSEELYQNLVKAVDPHAPESVHLCDFPVADLSKIDEKLEADTRLVMKVCSIGRAARSKAGIKVRQPVARVIVRTRAKSEQESLRCLAAQVLEELNVKALEFAEPDADLTGQSCYCTIEDGGCVVAVPTEIPADLIEEGIARELTHRIQSMRKEAGFEIADYIVTYYQAEHSLQKAIESQSAYIKQETLSKELLNQPPAEGVFSQKAKIEGREVTLGVKRVGG